MNGQLIKELRVSLKRYRQGLKNNHGSLFYSGLIKNTKEYIKELQYGRNKTSN
jgi:hypothetical protein